MRLRLAAFSLCLLISHTATAASFDCAKAVHPLEKIICSNPKLSTADDELAKAYKAKHALLLDKASFKSQQNDWMRLLRTQCSTTCTHAQVEAAYARQLANIASINEETFSASYKTGDEGILTISGHSAKGFAFSVERTMIDTPETTLCALPTKGAKAPLPFATYEGEGRALWKGPTGCILTFTVKRDAHKSVSQVALESSPACNALCTANYRVDDTYIPANNWGAGNQ